MTIVGITPTYSAKVALAEKAGFNVMTVRRFLAATPALPTARAHELQGPWRSLLKWLSDKDGFFELYAGLLALVAAGGKFEQHTVTEFYEQVVRATRGSPWVWTMTLASSIEGLARMLVPVGALRTDADEKALNALIAYLEAWDGPKRLKDTIIGRARILDQKTTSKALSDLANTGVGTKAQVDAWNDVRHAVMHGNLISPYTSEESDRKNILLADLMRALVRELARRQRADLRSPI